MSRLGMWACDAGKVSGIASCVVDLERRGSSLSVLRRRELSDARQVDWDRIAPGGPGSEIDDLSASWIGIALGSQFAQWKAKMRGEGVFDCVMVLEQYRLRAGTPAGVGLELLLPLTVNSALMGWLGGGGASWGTGRVMFVSPSDGKGIMKRDRLERAGCWEVGQQHSRDAWRYLAVALRRLRNEKTPGVRGS